MDKLDDLNLDPARNEPSTSSGKEDSTVKCTCPSESSASAVKIDGGEDHSHCAGSEEEEYHDPPSDDKGEPKHDGRTSIPSPTPDTQEESNDDHHESVSATAAALATDEPPREPIQPARISSEHWRWNTTFKERQLNLLRFGFFSDFTVLLDGDQRVLVHKSVLASGSLVLYNEVIRVLSDGINVLRLHEDPKIFTLFLQVRSKLLFLPLRFLYIMVIVVFIYCLSSIYILVNRVSDSWKRSLFKSWLESIKYLIWKASVKK